MKNLHAVALGKLGGEARANRTTRAQRQEWARLGGKARAAKYDKATLQKWAKLGGRPPKSEKATKHQTRRSKAGANE